VIEISGDAKVNGVVAKNTKIGERRNIALDSIFVELGYIAKTLGLVVCIRLF
jgi:thioredoxin reductase